MEGTSYDALSLAPDSDAFRRALLKRIHLLTTLSGGPDQRLDLPVLYRGKVERLAEALNELCWAAMARSNCSIAFAPTIPCSCRSGCAGEPCPFAPLMIDGLVVTLLTPSRPPSLEPCRAGATPRDPADRRHAA